VARPRVSPQESRAFIDIISYGRKGPVDRDRFSAVQLSQIALTVRRTPEVMVKVTGGGGTPGAVAAHLAYISGKGKNEIETDYGDGVDKEGQKELLKTWHLELTPGQYRRGQDGTHLPRQLKLTHNIVRSMPRPTPPETVLAAARRFAREQFGSKYRYAMALHTHQEHPHVHLVVKAEGLDGRRLHINKPMLREWREHFAQLMRDQGIPANATPRVARGRNKTFTKDAIFRMDPSKSRALHARVVSVIKELEGTGTIRDAARSRLLATRKAIVEGWMGIAKTLDAQGEIVLAGDVRYFATHLPSVLTDREKVAKDILAHEKARRLEKEPQVRQRSLELERTR
jgi:hypothetical protein